jgi:hypothetical protein
MYEQMWLVPLVFVPFILGLLVGLRVMKQKIQMYLMKKLSVEEIRKIFGEKKE